jgi:hypothetical protein
MAVRLGTCQGSFYYSLPLMDVERFTITRNGARLSSGGSGTMWIDYIVQTYDEQAQAALIGAASWEFYSIMLPEANAAIMVIRIESATGTLPVASLFRDDSGRTRNSVRANQEVVAGSTSKYEGLTWVEGTLGGPVKGTA